MTHPAHTPPEAAGPGIDDGAGGVFFGHDQRIVTHIEPRMSVAERDDIRAGAERKAEARARLYAAIPDEVLTALAAALHAAREEGRRRR